MRLIGLAVVLAVCLALAPLAVEAQQPVKLYRIGMLERTSVSTNAANLDGFRQGLRELGYVEGKNFAIEYRSADGRDERFHDLAAELVRVNVDLILTRGTPAALAAKNATRTIPVVMTGIGDPVGQGVVASLRPLPLGSAVLARLLIRDRADRGRHGPPGLRPPAHAVRRARLASGIHFAKVLDRLGIASEMKSKTVFPDPKTPAAVGVGLQKARLRSACT